MRLGLIGEMEMVTDKGREQVFYSTHNLDGQAVMRFHDAVAGIGALAADGWDGVKSPTVGEAVKEDAATGGRTTVNLGG